MNIALLHVLPGIPVPEEFYENWVSVPISELARTSGMSIPEVRHHTEELNQDRSAMLTIFHRLNDGEEWVSGYVFK